MAARRVIKKPSFSPQNYYRAPTPDKSSPSRPQRRLQDSEHSRRIGRLLKVVAVLSLVVGGWYFGTISGVSVISSGSDSNQSLEQQLTANLGGWRQIKPLINPGRLADQMKQADSSIAELNLAWSLGSRQLHASVVYRRAVAQVVSGQNQTGLIGQDGVFYTGIDTSDLPPVADTGGLTPKPGQQFVPIRSLDFIRLVEQSIAVLPQDIRASRRYQLVESSREIYLASGRPYVVKLNIERSAADQMQELAETLKFLARQKRVPSKYIDLRVDDTAYYR
jgi:hypothetical protein